MRIVETAWPDLSTEVESCLSLIKKAVKKIVKPNSNALFFMMTSWYNSSLILQAEVNRILNTADPERIQASALMTGINTLPTNTMAHSLVTPATVRSVRDATSIHECNGGLPWSIGSTIVVDSLKGRRSPSEASETQPDVGELSDLSDHEDDDEEDPEEDEASILDSQLMESGWPVNLEGMVPLPTMLTLMKVFGPEGLQLWRKDLHKMNKSSIVRAFKEWNPNFFTWFHRKRGMWVPVLGFREESKRRETSRVAQRTRKEG